MNYLNLAANLKNEVSLRYRKARKSDHLTVMSSSVTSKFSGSINKGTFTSQFKFTSCSLNASCILDNHPITVGVSWPITMYNM